MRSIESRCLKALFMITVPLLLNACAMTPPGGDSGYRDYSNYDASTYSSRLPARIDDGRGEKVVMVDPKVHAWGAYDENGELVRGGIATAGAYECEDSPGKSCHTGTGKFRVYSLGDENCISKIYPKPKGGGLMPYCMFFNNGEALHGSPDPTVVEANVSHGCVRMRIPDAEWLRTNFIGMGTRVVVQPY